MGIDDNIVPSFKGGKLFRWRDALNVRTI